MDNIDFEVTDAFAKNMSKGMMSSFSKLKFKRKSDGKKNSTSSTSSTTSQTSTGSNDSFDTSGPRTPRHSIWDARIQITAHNTLRSRLDHDIFG